MNLNETMLRQIIMDHYNNPQFKSIDSSWKIKRYNSPTCIDDITIGLVLENNTIKKIGFIGIACAICTSSTDIMIQEIKGKTVLEANKIIENYLNMIKGKEFNEDELNELIAFKNVNRQPSRVNCATLGINLIKEMINE
ncbi:hypothetical protein ASO20_00905 [Mycoplasma sp. (ex Biomphalaria glabrata)]|uniref:Fe-S cluster assembly sulfur transfer protein SufU n=1 Tax=Mycoplasma sp. (ex Biomphalaria glabrata) TaxID=1749074 RepID=UPI00073A603D|nr:SUF system NifU family Fe-S cluster assembly protein [Mycoplasma sp. (ex Biomphalaria glabrata)]ALV23228.1 hypothetical protein ASO20_00905 [Mycoplasma sp. (ex Biomphalaria glabrata)]